MRADRLISIILLLQGRGRMAAPELARELEVSIRTIYRDMDALSAAGIPVYAEQGRGGGFVLHESYRTTLTGLHRDEVRALMLSIPGPLEDLGLADNLRSALRKMDAALPSVFRFEAESIRSRIHLDWSSGSAQNLSVSIMDKLQEALFNNRLIRLVYRSFFATRIERIIQPYGLVSSAGSWYLVFLDEELFDVLRVARLEGVDLQEGTFKRSDEFHIRRFWEEWCIAAEARLMYSVRIRVMEAMLPHLVRVLQGREVRVEQGTGQEEDGVLVQIDFDNFEEARRLLLEFGQAVEVLAPQALRWSVADFAAQTALLYNREPRLPNGRKQ